MDKNTSGLKKAGAYYFVGSLFNKGIAFLTVPIFTRLLSTSDYGIVTTYNSWVAILAMIMGFALHTSVRIAFIEYRNEMNHYMATITMFTLLSSFALSIVILIVAKAFGGIDILIVLLCLCHAVASSLIEDYSMYLMMQYKFRFRTALMVFPNLLSVIISVVLLKFFFIDHLYMARIIPSAVITLLFGVMICYLVFQNSKCFFNCKYLRNALRFSVPLILHGIALNILSQSDRTMITVLADSAQTGIYSLIYNFSMIATVITTSLEGIWIPWFYQKIQERAIEEVNVVAKDYIHLMTYCLIGVILIGPEIVKLLASSDYWDGITIIPAVVISNFVVFAYSLYVNIEHFYRKTQYITANTGLAAGINLLLNYIFIPRYGYIAAAYTTLISYLFALFFHAGIAKKLEPCLYPISIFASSLVHIMVAGIIFFSFTELWVIRWVAVLLYIPAMLYFNRSRIKAYFPTVIKKFTK